MFNADGLQALYEDQRETLDMVNEVAEALKLRFYRMDEAIDCLMIAAMSGEAMVMIGPPGTAKSRLVRVFCNLIGLVDDAVLERPGSTPAGKRGDAPGDGKPRVEAKPQQRRYFEYLLTQFTEPSELFGFYDLAALNRPEPKLERITTNMMQEVEVVFLDEVFNASSAILNALLTFMNERKFHDRGVLNPTELRLLVSATNHPPRDPTLQAVYDRFLLRCWVHNVAQPATGDLRGNLASLAKFGWSETHAPPAPLQKSWRTLLDRLVAMHDKVDEMTRKGKLRIDEDHMVFTRLADLVVSMVRADLSTMSNRRLVKLLEVVLVASMMRAAARGDAKVEITEADLDVVLRYSRDRDDLSELSKIEQNVLHA